MKISTIIFRYLAFLVLIAIPPIVLDVTGNNAYIITHFWLLFAYLSALTFLVILLVLLVQQRNKEMYAQAFLAGTTIKMLGCLIFVLVFLHKTPVNKLAFGCDFFYIYFFNTAFEVYGLLRNLRNQNSR